MRGNGHISDPLRAVLRKPDFHDGCERFPGDLHAVRVIAIQKHHSVLRHDAQEMAEARLDLLEVLKNIRVIELDVIHDHEFRQVVHKLRALVEKRAVVLIAFDYEMLRVLQARALPEILRNAANHVAGIEARLVHDPGQKRGRGRLSMRSGDDEIVPTAQEELLEHLRQREVIELPVQDRFHFRVAARDCVSDYDHFGVRGNIFCRVAGV